MYKQVLLAYDGSLEGARALREGALLAKQCGAKVFLLGVVAGSTEMLLAESGYGEAMARQRQDYLELMKHAVARLKDMGLQTTARLVEGQPTPSIASVAREISADLVVVGHHNEGLFTRWWSGSQQDFLSDHLTCTIVIARTPMTDEAFEAEVARLAGN